MLFLVIKFIHKYYDRDELRYELEKIVQWSVNKERDLGVIIDKNAKSSEQCFAAANAANRVLRLIRRKIHCKSKDIIMRLYKGLVRPKIEYFV